MQKTYTDEHLTGIITTVRRHNFNKKHHEAIISHEEFEAVGKLLNQREKKKDRKGEQQVPKSLYVIRK